MKDTYHNFGGRNKARRIAKLRAKGKTEKADKLQKKLDKIVKKLEEKGKVDGNRYLFLKQALETDRGLSITEMEELETIEEKAADEDPAISEEIDKELETIEESEESETWIPKVPNAVTVVVGFVLFSGAIIGALAAAGVFKKKAKKSES